MQCRLLNIAQLPSGKAPDFDSGIRWFESNLGSQEKGSALAEPNSSKEVISMTKDEFYNDVEDFSDLINFCEEHGCVHIIENIRESDMFDDWVWDVLENNRHRWFWHDVRDMLDRVEAPTSDYFSTPEGTSDLTYEELWDGYDLDRYKDMVADWGDDEDFWDEEHYDDEAYDDDDSDCCWDEVIQEEPGFTSDIEITMLIGVA